MSADRLAASARKAKDRWPDVVLAFEDYAGGVASRATDVQSVQDGALVDLYLAIACERLDKRALVHFERDILAAVKKAVHRIDARPEFADEVRQIVRERLLVGPRPKIGDYRGRGSLIGWVSVTAIRIALGLRRQAQRAESSIPHEWAEAMAAADTLDVELETFKASHHAAFASALRGACSDVAERERSILRMQFLEGYGIDRLAEAFGVHRSTAARWVTHAREALLVATRARLKAEEQIASADAQLIERLLHSQLSVSFSGLREEPGTNLGAATGLPHAR